MLSVQTSTTRFLGGLPRFLLNISSRELDGLSCWGITPGFGPRFNCACKFGVSWEDKGVICANWARFGGRLGRLGRFGTWPSWAAMLGCSWADSWGVKFGANLAAKLGDIGLRIACWRWCSKRLKGCSSDDRITAPQFSWKCSITLV